MFDSAIRPFAVSAPLVEMAPWPKHLASAKELHEWLNKLTLQDGVPVRIILGMRWLVLAELARSVPEPEQKALPEFISSEVNGFDAQPLGTTYRGR